MKTPIHTLVERGDPIPVTVAALATVLFAWSMVAFPPDWARTFHPWSMGLIALSLIGVFELAVDIFHTAGGRQRVFFRRDADE